MDPPQALTDLVFIVCLNDVQRLLSVTNRATQQDEPVGDQAVHELGMLGPAMLLTDTARGILARAVDHDECKVGHQSVLNIRCER